MINKMRRLQRLLIGPEHRCLMVALDHAPWLGPVKGLDRPRAIVEKVVAGGANALLMTPGFAREVMPVVNPSVAIVLRTSIALGPSSEAHQETPIATVKAALQMDADAVVVSTFFGRSGEVEIIRYLGKLIEECNAYGMPVVAEMIPSQEKSYDAKAIAHVARIGMELGADIVKTNYCADVDAFRRVVASVPVPILVAGGPTKGNDEETLQMVREVVEAGAAGVAFGRRVWQSPNPRELVEKTREIVFPSEQQTARAV